MTVYGLEKTSVNVAESKDFSIRDSRTRDHQWIQQLPPWGLLHSSPDFRKD